MADTPHTRSYPSFEDPPPRSVSPDTQIGEVFRRLFQIRELGEGAFSRTVQAVLVTLGRSAMVEAERRAATLAERDAPGPCEVRATPWGLRRKPDGFDPGDATK